MPGALEDQVAIVTGAGRGFGAAIARRFAAEGAAVAVTARSRGEIDRVANEIRAAGGQSLAVAGDVTDRGDVARVAAETAAAFGAVTLLVNNAGLGGPYGPTWLVDPDDWWRSEAIHIRAPVLFMNALMPAMVERRHGRVIIVSAIASHIAAPHLTAYCVGKMAQARLAKQVALEAKEHGVSIFAIDPGFVITALAEETMTSPDAKRWLPEMVRRLGERKDAGHPTDDLARCAQRCVDLASGRYDGLSGGYFELPDDLDSKLRELAGSS